jgi:hypothetical protein
LKLKPVEARVESAWFQRLKLRYDDSLSNVAFNVDVRRCIAGRAAAVRSVAAPAAMLSGGNSPVTMHIDAVAAAAGPAAPRR